MTSKCDIIRDTANAFTCGMCKAIAANPPSPIPAGCAPAGGAPPPPAACGVPNAANARMKLFASQLSPKNIFEGAAGKAVRTQEEKIYEGIIESNAKALAAAYPNAPAGALAVSWPDLELCLRDKTGAAAGKKAYFGRSDALGLGMNPVYPVGGAFAENAIWKAGKAESPVPLAVDYVVNPDLFAILLFALLVVVFAVLIWKAWKSAKAAPYVAEKQKEAARARLEASDPFKGSAFETYPDPQAKCRAYVETMEQQGYDMTYYRDKCGLPAKP